MSKRAPVDRKSPAYALEKYNTARISLLVAVGFTLVNIILEIAGTDYFFLFSLVLPYWEFTTTTLPGILIPAVSMLFFVLCGLLSKKHFGFMIAGFVGIILDCGYLGVLIAYFMMEGAGILMNFGMEILFHIWLVIESLLGVIYGLRATRYVREGTPPETLTPAEPETAEQPESTLNDKPLYYE